MPTVPWHALPPLLPHWSQLPLLCLPLNKQSLCPVLSPVTCLSSVPSCLDMFGIRMINLWPLTWVTRLGRCHSTLAELVSTERQGHCTCLCC